VNIDSLEASEALDLSDQVRARTRQELAVEALLVIPNVAKLLTRLIRDPAVPIRRKILVGAVLAYVVSPIDLIPDFVIGFGRLDDLILVSLALDHILDGTDDEIVSRHWDGSQDALDLVQSASSWAAAIIPGAVRRFLPG